MELRDVKFNPPVLMTDTIKAALLHIAGCKCERFAVRERVRSDGYLGFQCNTCKTEVDWK